MVAAGATVLMAASEESSSNGAGNNSSECENQTGSSQCNEVQCSEQSVECKTKKNVMACTSDKEKKRSHMLERSSRITPRVENKDYSKNLSLHKAVPIRETKTSRLRAASIVSPNSVSSLSKKLGVSESSASWSLQASTSLSAKEDNLISSNSGSTMNPIRERDKSYKRKSYLNRSFNAETVSTDRLNQSEHNERRSIRQSNKQSHISETIYTDSAASRQITSNLQKKNHESKTTSSRSPQCNINRSKMQSSNVTYAKSRNTSQSSTDGHSDSEVSRRVDVLTALTKATMERVERLASHTNSALNSGQRSEVHLISMSPTRNLPNNQNNTGSTVHIVPTSLNKYSILKKSNDEYSIDNCSMRQPPVSILKHKIVDNEGNQSSSNTCHNTLPVTFSPSVTEPIHKRHGILKKRSSLDESEILRRRSYSPDVSFTDNSYSEFRPILKNQRRSSLDESLKRDQSPDPQPTSILKRKSSREDDREDQLGSPEPQGILKRKTINNARTNSTNHHVTIATDPVSCIETFEGSEVRPILKKKHSREESSGNDPPYIEPRPILKKKSSTESDEHEDRPKKTILKCSRKSSQEDCNYDIEITSPKKLTMLKNRGSQCRSAGLLETDCVKPILKQPGSRESETRVRLNIRGSAALDLPNDPENLFSRKRAQSLGQMQPCVTYGELNTVMLTKQRSLESTSLGDTLEDRTYSKSTTGNNYSKIESSQFNESSISTTPYYEVSGSTSTEENFPSKSHKDKRTISILDAPLEKKTEPDIFFMNDDSDIDTNSSAQMSNTEFIVDTKSIVDEIQEQLHASDTDEDQDSHNRQRSNSVSKLTLHFMTMQEKAISKEKNVTSQGVKKKVSHGIQRYRERKMQGNDRFNTQPVTLQEVQEAVLQNQRNAVSHKNTNVHTELKDIFTTDDEYDPSKLSLAERVRLFNQKIVIEKSSTSNKMPQEKYQRRRPATRYKTQPVTSEEVEVASRISPLSSINQVIGTTIESEDVLDISSSPSASQDELPRSILKSSTSHTHNISRSKSPELEGLKLIKSVLKKESEEQQLHSSETCDIVQRTIVKPNNFLKQDEFSLDYDNCESSDKNISSQKKSFIDERDHDEPKEKVTDVDKQIVYHTCNVEKSENTEGIENETEQRHIVPFTEKLTSQDKSYNSKTNTTLDDIDNVRIENICKKYNTEWKPLSADDTPQTSDDEASSSGGREVRSIIKNEAVARRRQNTLTKQTRYMALSKSASHHALSSESESNIMSKQKQHNMPLLDLCRSATQTIPVSKNNDCPSMSIAERLAALQRSGNTNWKRRIITESNKVVDSCSTGISKEDLTIRQGVLADCLGKLESATEGWKKRIATSDAMKFTVAGKMQVEQSESIDLGPPSPLVEITAHITDKKKKTPRLKRFRGKKDIKDILSTPSSPNIDLPLALRRSYSEPTSDESGEESKEQSNLAPIISIPKVDDETFTSFFAGMSLEKCSIENFDLTKSDFDIITMHSKLLVQKRNIQTQRRRAASKNPIKALALRTDLKSEYIEVRSGIAEKITKSLNIEKLAKNSALAVEALAGLASTEDFSAITLRNAGETNISINKLKPYKDLMLILIKGRRHVQARLVEPVADSMNSGDNYVLITRSEIYNYVGKFSNVIEKARAAEIALSIQQNKDLGCQASQVITIDEDKLTCKKSQLQKFWSYLGVNDDHDIQVIDGGHPDEDESYESAIIGTNMVYEIKNEELIPLEEYWGTIPKIEMLGLNKILIFDFGSEMYIWTGKGASSDKKKVASRLATEMWGEGYDYTECAVCPITAASMIGRRVKLPSDIKSAKSRPNWCLFAKLTQHVETVLFREKFLDWPNVSGIIKMKNFNDKEQIDGTITIEPCDMSKLTESETIPVDLNLEGSHLGRGTGWYDDELMKQYVVETTSVTVWHIDEFSHTLLHNSSIGQFYTKDSYIIKWMYTVTITGRELSGLPSKHSAKGRDRSVYFIWQGQNASLNEQGAAALLTVELDNDQGRQIRVVEGYEPAAFLNLFSGGMILHRGKRTDKNYDRRWRLYICRGTLESETFLIEIPCSTRQLRSRGSLILLDNEISKLYVWHGSNTLPHIKKNALVAANKLKKNLPQEAGLTSNTELHIFEIDEGAEPEEFFNALGGMNRMLYMSLEKSNIQTHTPRLFHLSCISKEFKATELLCPHRASMATPFPFLQDDLYQVSQPALFLLDNKNEVWIWQGWWPDTEAEDHSGSKVVRWQAERKATMTMAMQYWHLTHPETTKCPIFLVWAGLEPLQFINLFPTWIYRDDIAELNMEDGRKPGEVLTVESELARLTQSTYPPAQLLQRPLPIGVDPTRLELYLSRQHFQELLGMSNEEFQELPVWKQVNLKKEVGLF